MFLNAIHKGNQIDWNLKVEKHYTIMALKKPLGLTIWMLCRFLFFLRIAATAVIFLNEDNTNDTNAVNKKYKTHENRQNHCAK